MIACKQGIDKLDYVVDSFNNLEVGRRVLTLESDALAAQAGFLDENFSRAVNLLHSLKGRIVCSGIGKSGHVARKLASTFASTGAPAFFVHPAEASHGDLGMIGGDDALLLLSKSGEAKELSDLLIYAKRFGIPIIAVTAALESALGSAADIPILLANVPEATACVSAPTTSTSLQIAIGDALAVALLERKGFTSTQFRNFHPGGKLGAMLLTVGDIMHRGDQVPLVGHDCPMGDALLVMTSKAFGILGVTSDEGALLGVISDGDLRRHMDGLLDKTASQVMTAGGRVVEQSCMASEALRLMTDVGPAVTTLFITNGNVPIGVIQMHDIIRRGVV
ncbi:KpsF/GutQ family sugar-phosphate isomerase [Caulobacter sp. ErkDOM-E]|uniref:KpsF/GutQ family sugar-phosphate isomerase n=1 Tax=Caulobacter sp. ErkDOM-E TaxID=3402778 RepID=UPI003AF86E76